MNDSTLSSPPNDNWKTCFKLCILPGMLSALALLATLIALLALPAFCPAQDLARRLILKDGSYQLVTKYEVERRPRTLPERRAQ